MLPLTVRNKEAIFIMISITNYRYTVEMGGHGRLLGQCLLPPQSNSLDRKPLKGTLKKKV